MDELEKLRKEIEILKGEIHCGGYKSAQEHSCDACIVDIYQNILSLIDSMQKEHVSEDWEKEIEKMWAQELRYRDTDYTITELTKQDYEDCARHFAKWQKQQTINKACEYLKDNIWRNLYFVNGEAGFPTAEFIKGFRKAMEE